MWIATKAAAAEPKTVAELYQFLEGKIPPSLSASWDHDGLAVAPNPHRTVRKVLVALDVTKEAVSHAVLGDFDVILTHHPLLFRGLQEVTPQKTVAEKVITLVQNGIAAMAFHTRLDAVEGGVNDVLARLLSLKETAPFGPLGEIPCGRVGTLKTPMTAGAFGALVTKALHSESVLLAGDAHTLIHRVALLGGEGGDYVEAAKESGAELFLSGRIGYHRMLDGPEEGLLLMEAGHRATEYPVTGALAQMVRGFLPAAEIEIFEDAPILQIGSGEKEEKTV